MHDVQPKKTVDDYMRLPEETRVELLEGEFVVSPSPDLRHQRILGALFSHLKDFVRRKRLGEIVLSPFDCVLSRETVVQPDLIFVRPGRVQPSERLHGPPDVAIEVLSRTHSDRDRVRKHGIYARSGVPEFWIVDPDARTVEVMRLENDTYRLLGIFAGDEPILSPTFEGLHLRISQVFE